MNSMEYSTGHATRSARHLHPLSLIFEIARMIRGNIIPTIAALISAKNGGWIGFGIGLSIISIGIAIALIRFYTYRYQISDGELVIHEGLFGRLHRTVPVGRIQNIDLLQNVFHRLLGVAEVRVETASGNEPEAIMRVLAISEFKKLKEELLLQQKTGVDAKNSNTVVTNTSSENHSSQLIFALPTRLIVLAGLLSNRGEVIAGILLGLFWQSSMGESMFPWVKFVKFDDENAQESARASAKALGANSDSIKRFINAIRDDYGLLGLFSLLIVSLLLLFAVLRMFSAIWYVLRFHGYRLELHDESLHVQCGLLTKVSATIPRGRVQLVSVQRSWLARRFGLAAIRIETAGGSGDKSEDAASSIGRKWFLPIIEYKDVPFVLTAIDERIKFNDPSIEWKPLSRDTAKRMLRPILFVAMVVFLLGLYVRPTGGWAIGILVGVLGWLYVAKKSKSRRYARTDWGIIYRSGTLLQKCSMTFFEKMQSSSLNQSPFDRRWGMATLAVDTASAGPADHRIEIGYLDATFASQEFDTIQNKINFAE